MAAVRVGVVSAGPLSSRRGFGLDVWADASPTANGSRTRRSPATTADRAALFGGWAPNGYYARIDDRWTVTEESD
jgi:hypothetical protein